MDPRSRTPLGERLTARQKFLVLNSLMLCIFISALDGSIVATAAPHIVADLGGFELLSWVFTGYLVASTAVVPIVGKLSDMFGRKLFLLAGVVLFAASSAACGFAGNMPALVLGRGIQGIAGGMLVGVTFTTLGDIFTPIERARYMGYFQSAFTLASLIGPTLGGALTDGGGWRWCFLINLPVCAAALLLLSRFLPAEGRHGRFGDIDFAGAGLLAAATVSLLLGLAWSVQEFGWTSGTTLTCFALAVLLGVVFVRHEARHPHAILPVSLFRNRTFVQTNVMSSFQLAGMFGAIQYLPTFVQVSLGASATASGLVSTPQALGFFGASIVAAQLVSRTGRFKRQLIAASVVSLVGFVLLAQLSPDTARWHVAMLVVLVGASTALIGPTSTVIIQASVTHDQIGVASGGRQFFAQIGQVMGVAVFGLLFTTTYTHSFSSTLPDAERAAMGEHAFEQMKDPTLSVNESTFAPIREEILARPGGGQLLGTAQQAQREAVADAINRVFLGAALAAVVVMLCAVTIREIPLRNAFAVREEKGDPATAVP